MLAAFGIPAIVLAGCGGDDATPTTLGVPQELVLSYVTGSNDSQFFQEAFAQALENPNGANLRVARLSPLPSVEAEFEALRTGRIDLVAAYARDLLPILKALPAEAATTTPTPGSSTQGSSAGATSPATAPGTTPAVTTPTLTTPTGTTPALTTPAGTTPAGSTPGSTADTLAPVNIDNPQTSEEVAAAINTLLPQGVTMGLVSPGQRAMSIACTAETVSTYSLATLSGMAAAAPQIVVGAPAGFDTAEPLGAATLQATYGWAFKQAITIADDEALRKAVTDKTAGCFVVDSGSPLLATLALTVINDDRFVVPANPVVVLADTNIDPIALMVAEQVSIRLTNTNMSAVFAAMGNGVQPHSAAQSFLESAQPDPEPVPQGSVPFDTTLSTSDTLPPATLPGTVPNTVPGTGSPGSSAATTP